jgi:putative membrane protein
LALCGALAIWLLLVLSRAAIALVVRVDYRWISWGTLVVLLVLVAALTGWGGLLITVAATGIGLIPIAFHSRRVNCMGVLLLPVFLNLIGAGPIVAGWLGLT